MTTRPRSIDLDRSLIPGLIAVALFVLMAITFLTEGFADPNGFPDVSIVGAIGWAIIGAPEHAGVDTESFIVALILLAILLDAALDGALMLAKRDEEGED